MQHFFEYLWDKVRLDKISKINSRFINFKWKVFKKDVFKHTEASWQNVYYEDNIFQNAHNLMGFWVFMLKLHI